LLALSQASLAATCTTPIPLPPHFTSVGDEDDEDYRPLPVLHGIHASGWIGTFEDGAFCAGTADEAQAAQEASGMAAPTQYWLYATQAQAILFMRSLSIDASKPCGTPAKFSQEVQRAFIANGIVHSFAVDKDNNLEPIASRSINSSDGIYSGAFFVLHNLVARPSGITARSQRTETIAGTRSRCFVNSGLVWDSLCLADTGPSRGMILAASAGDDERVLFNLQAVTLIPNACLDGRLFETDRAWSVKK
jgi:hypothetical protein